MGEADPVVGNLRTPVVVSQSAVVAASSNVFVEKSSVNGMPCAAAFACISANSNPANAAAPLGSNLRVTVNILSLAINIMSELYSPVGSLEQPNAGRGQNSGCVAFADSKRVEDSKLYKPRVFLLGAQTGCRESPELPGGRLTRLVVNL